MRTLGKHEIPSQIQFYDDNVKKAYLELGKTEKKEEWSWLKKAIEKAFKDLKMNCHAGDQIPNNKISNKILKKFDVETLWRYELGNGWRLLYSPVSGDIEVLSIVLGWGDHKWYTKVLNP